MALNIFELFGVISLKTNDAKQEIDDIKDAAKGLAEQLGATDTTAGKSVGKGSKLDAGAVWLGNTATKMTTLVGRAISKLPGKMVESAAEVNAKTAAFHSTFGELADSASAIYKSIGEEANILETRLRSVGTKGFSQLKGAGLSATDALSESERMLRLAADAAAYYDISLEDADSRIRSFMRVNVEAGDAIGLFTSEGQRNEAALEAYGQKFKDLTEAQKQLLLLNIADSIYKSNGVFGQASRESMEYANVTANAAEASTVSLATFGTQINNSLIPALHNLTNWLMDENTQKKLGDFAVTLGDISSLTFGAATSFFQWCVDNSEAVSVAFNGIVIAVGALVAKTHPWLAAIEAVLGGLTQVYLLQQDINETEDKYGLSDPTVKTAIKNQNATKKSPFAILRELNETNATVEVGAELQDGAGANLQNELDGQNLSVDVRVNPIMSWFNNLFTRDGSGAANYKIPEPDGSHASGIDYIPFDNYRAILHRGETVLNAKDAALWRSGSMTADNSRLESLMGSMIWLMQQVVANTAAGQNVVLDTGVLVGSISPAIDRQLGTIANRRGRG